MPAKEIIIDYKEHSDEIEKWLALKGETKYMRFASLLEANNVVVEWQVLRDAYRYDKRLLVNLFKYFSFFEEFLRAQIWNVSQSSYKKLEKAYLVEVINEVINLKSVIQYNGFSVDNLIENKDLINYLRNRVSHNKIILESTKNGVMFGGLISALKNTLPENYRDGFSLDINNCAKRLNLPSCLILEI